MMRKRNNILSEQELECYNKYAIEIVKKAIKNMNGGYIQCSPFKSKCITCEFNKICKSSNDEKMERGEDYEVTNEIFLELKYEQ